MLDEQQIVRVALDGLDDAEVVEWAELKGTKDEEIEGALEELYRSTGFARPILVDNLPSMTFYYAAAFATMRDERGLVGLRLRFLLEDIPRKAPTARVDHGAAAAGRSAGQRDQRDDQQQMDQSTRDVEDRPAHHPRKKKHEEMRNERWTSRVGNRSQGGLTVVSPTDAMSVSPVPVSRPLTRRISSAVSQCTDSSTPPSFSRPS